MLIKREPYSPFNVGAGRKVLLELLEVREAHDLG